MAALQEAIRADHEDAIADAERRAVEEPDEWGRRFYADRARRLRAMPLPGQG